MDCVGIDPGNSYLWISLAGIFFGGGFSFLLCPVRRRRADIALVFFSAFILAIMAGAVLADINLSSYSHMLIWFGSSAGLGFCCFLFWKAVGIPLIFISVITVSAFYSAVLDWSCVVPDSEIVRINLISRTDEFIRIQYQLGENDRLQQKIDSQELCLNVELLELPYYLFITKAGLLYRFNGFSSAGSEAPVLSKKDSLFDAIIMLPAVKYRNAVSDALAPFPAVDYIYGLDKNGRISFTRDIRR